MAEPENIFSFTNDSQPMPDDRPKRLRKVSLARCMLSLGNTGSGIIEYTEVSPESAAKLLGVTEEGIEVQVGLFKGALVVSTRFPEEYAGLDPDKNMLPTRGQLLADFVHQHLVSSEEA